MIKAFSGWPLAGLFLHLLLDIAFWKISSDVYFAEPILLLQRRMIYVSFPM